MTSDEVIADLNERIDKGVTYLKVKRQDPDEVIRKAELSGKIRGLLLVKDWLRSYPKDPPSCNCYTIHEDTSASCPINY